AQLLADTGLSVISDVDDTIKVSHVRDRRALLRKTFYEPFQAVDGMAAVYRAWATNGANFHYVSASPWQLYEPLAEFTATNGFPAGSWHLKQFRVKDGSFLALFDSPEHYKPAVIEPMLRQFPNRRFILVGDSGERDPEIYGALARKFPQQVHRIYIRDVTDEDAEAARYQTAFKDVPRERWSVFRQPSEIRNGVNP
ncbi:MAG: phosphatidate phosphatase App1 family protein, partial [Limisphaerales bacterium]